MTQGELELFSTQGTSTAAARTSDPDTSHQAANRVERKGKAATNRKRILGAVRARQGGTACEYAKELSMDRHETSRRLPELRADGEIGNAPGWGPDDPKEHTRICKVKKTSMLTWWALY